MELDVVSHLFKGAILLFAGMIFTYCLATYFELKAARPAERTTTEPDFRSSNRNHDAARP